MAGDPFYDDMVLLWRGNNGFVDESDSGLTLTPQQGYDNPAYNAGGWAWVEGKFPGTTAGKLQGNRPRISIGASLLNGATAFTLEAWVNSGTSATGSRWIAAQNSWGVASSFGLYISHLNGVSVAYKPGSTTYSLAQGNNPPNNTWVHVAWTRSGGTHYLFIDGILKSSGAVSGTMGAETMYIGQNSTSSGLNSHIIDDFIVYNKAIYTSNFTPRSFEPPTYQLNDKLIPRKELQHRQPTRLNQNYFIHRTGL